MGLKVLFSVGEGRDGVAESCGAGAGYFFFQAIQPLHKEAESPGSCIVLLKHIQFMGGTASQVNISGSTSLPLTDLQHLGALQPPFKIDLYFLLLPFNLFPLLLCLHLVQHRT